MPLGIWGSIDRLSYIYIHACMYMHIGIYVCICIYVRVGVDICVCGYIYI
jgi:hypothetical protein